MPCSKRVSCISDSLDCDIDGNFNPADLLTKLLTAEIQKPHIKRIFINKVQVLGEGLEALFHSPR